MIFSLGTAFHAPVLFFVFRVRLLLSSDRTRWIIRCVSIPVAVPTVLIHLPICADALDRARYELSLSRSPSASGSSAQIVVGLVHPVHPRSSAKPSSGTCMQSSLLKSGDKVRGGSGHSKPTRANDVRWPRSPGCDASDAGVPENAVSREALTSPPSGRLPPVPNAVPCVLPW